MEDEREGWPDDPPDTSGNSICFFRLLGVRDVPWKRSSPPPGRGMLRDRGELRDERDPPLSSPEPGAPPTEGVEGVEALLPMLRGGVSSL